MQTFQHSGIEIRAPLDAAGSAILTPAALEFLSTLERNFRARRKELLARRVEIQARLDAGERPDFLAATAGVRTSTWKAAPPPRDLLDRRVEITGPTDRKMIINALSSGANVFMADFEDSNAPSFENLIVGQQNLFDAVRRTIRFEDPKSGKSYRLAESVATLVVRPRGWHLEEKHLLVDGKPMSGSLFDFGLFFFHNARELVARGSGPYFYLPKLENHQEARLWNEVFLAAQDALGLPIGTIRATVLIETILAAFEMDEILYELREHSTGLNCGRWDYIFSFIKKFRNRPDCVLPDRDLVGMTQPFLRAYSQLLIQTCHRRGVHAMGGMAAQIPIKSDAARNEAALAKVRADKEREAGEGHDGTWVAHPGLVAVAREVFDARMPGPHQFERARGDVHVTADDLLRVPGGAKTLAGLRKNVSIGVQYLAAWLSGNGCVPLYDLMEDAATAEISRAQVWQWIRHGIRLDSGQLVDRALFARVLEEELALLRTAGVEDQHAPGRLALAAKLFGELSTATDFTEFLTLPLYEHLLTANAPNP
ncbi:MAG TPA: malate synthase A [Planctomycetota bacterium]|nr:malate synthase A [Planctomycetota bacterium]